MRKALRRFPPCLRPFGRRKYGTFMGRNPCTEHLHGVLGEIKPLGARLGSQSSLNVGWEVNGDEHTRQNNTPSSPFKQPPVAV